MKITIKEEVKVSSRLWLGGADCMITTLCNIITGGALTFFFVNYFGMNAKLSATCWMLFGLWNAVNDPLFGYISDKTKSKLGRRIPYIRYGAVLIAAIFVLSWVVWFDAGSDIQIIMTVIGVVAGLTMFVGSFFFKEKGYVQEEEQYPFIQSLVNCFKNKSFLIFETISFSVTFIQTALMMGLSYYFDALQVNYLYCYLAMFLGIFLGMFLWMKPGKKWGVKKSIVYMCLIFGIGLLIMLLFGKYTVAGVIGFLCAGIGFAGGMYMVPIMFGDVIDYDEHTSGLRREGMYAGVNSFVCKPAISIANAALCFRYSEVLSVMR